MAAHSSTNTHAQPHARSHDRSGALGLDPFADVGLSPGLLEVLIAEHTRSVRPRLERLWTYYRNPMTGGAGSHGSVSSGRGGSQRAFRLGQEAGLPARLGGRGGWSAPAAAMDDRIGGSASGASVAGREVVIENDIAWRLHTMVEFMFGKPIRFRSTAADETVRARIESALDAVWQASGGIALLQDMALLGHIYGHVDLIVRPPADPPAGATDAVLHGTASPGDLPRIEVIEPTRGIPLLNAHDFRTIDAYILHFERESTEVEAGATGYGATLRRWLGRANSPDQLSPHSGRRRITAVTEILSASWRRVYECDTAEGRRWPRLIDDGPNTVSPGAGGGVPVVHIQNQSQPFAYNGLGEVEPLIPLQDELNTRLSDRASRVTLQSFKMYLAKGIEGFATMPVAPGAMWSTDNPDASIQAFGGDGASPSEERHVEEIREALDKASGVPPLATGVVRAKVGNLTSENALRITLTGLLSKTARKRVTYGRGLADACRLVLAALDHSGALHTDEADRGVRVEWPDPLPRDEEQAVRIAKAKLDLGVPAATVLGELGYAGDEGVI